MRVITTDGNRYVNIGGYEIWKAFCSTILYYCKDMETNVADALHFLEKGNASGKKGNSIARQFNLIRDRLSQIKPEDIMCDIENADYRGAWVDRLSPVITSCGNLFTTAEGKDLVFELVSIFCYANIIDTDVVLE